MAIEKPTDPNTCPECWGVPMGTGCYHICPNSTHYYSPEQERADEPFYGMDDNKERYAAETFPFEDDDWTDEPAATPEVGA